ncbi:MAG: MATE family efflux transporter [Muribaculaceae bacterium]|nr:MATE family efflux transporter [Muribaculaceae bacterium]
MAKQLNLIEGNIFGALTRFSLPVIFALFLQALYGGIDLLIVGQFSSTPEVSGVATGSMLMHTITMVITAFAMGITILVGRRIGERNPEEAGRTIGVGIYLFLIIGLVLSVVTLICSDWLSMLMHAPDEAFEQTSSYVAICGGGSLFIVAYNVLGSIFRGLGDSKTPLLTVAIACVLNIVGDLIFVALFDMGAAGAAWATVLSQAVSVVISYIIIRRMSLPFAFKREFIRYDAMIVGRIMRLGSPLALQELLVGVSFLIIQVIVNAIGVVESAGVGVAEKICVFIMLLPSGYGQSMAAFVAQNYGARRMDRANRALFYGILTSLCAGIVTGYTAFFHGDVLSSWFVTDAMVIDAAHSYLKAYAIDCIFTAFLFCFMGYYNGCGSTFFVMIQGIIGALGVRVPAVFIISNLPDVTLFEIGLATPLSSIVQIILCIFMFVPLHRKMKLEVN